MKEKKPELGTKLPSIDISTPRDTLREQEVSMYGNPAITQQGGTIGQLIRTPATSQIGFGPDTKRQKVELKFEGKKPLKLY